jgi:alpha-tubulin suppressor-like RCC1 family protein
MSDATCTLHPKGRVRCAGARFDRKGFALDPEPLDFGAPVAELGLGKVHGCARMEDGTAQCWGQNADGQLGDGTTKPHAPASVPSLHGVVQIAASIHGSCALVASGRVKCWGEQSVDGATVSRPSPFKVEGAVDMSAVAVGQDHACALARDGGVRCWGRNADGDLGDGTYTDRAAAGLVAGITDATAISVGGHFTCALLRDGTVQCWGSNVDGALGDGTSLASRASPSPVASVVGATHIATGWRHACARLTTGSVLCWGQNTFGQVGDGTTTTRSTPVAVKGGDTFVSVAAGRQHTCGLRDDGTLVCWGRNQEGQLGDGTRTDRLEPTRVRF